MDALVIFLGIFGIGGCLGFGIAWVVTLVNLRRTQGELSASEESRTTLGKQSQAAIQGLKAEVERAKPWIGIADADGVAKAIVQQAEAEAEEMKSSARILLSNAEEQYDAKVEATEARAAEILGAAQLQAKNMKSEAEEKLLTTIQLTRHIRKGAEADAARVAGNAFKAVQDAERFTKVGER